MSRNGDTFAPVSRCCEYREAKLDFASAGNYMMADRVHGRRLGMRRRPVQGAGGIVLRLAAPPLIAVVRLRKQDEWVLPKGKIDDGETPRTAAEREVNEETGHDVTVHEFLGTLVYESGRRSKVVHYWRMEADGEQHYQLTSDVREVEWLPLDAALERLSRSYERIFLENVGPLALDAAVAARSRLIVEATPAGGPTATARPPGAEAATPIDPCAPMTDNRHPAMPRETDPPEPARDLAEDRPIPLAARLGQWLRRA